MHLAVVKHVLYLLAIAATPVAGVIALFKGDKPERLGAVVFIGAILVTDAVFALSKPLGYSIALSIPYIDLVSTFALSCFFLYLAIRYASLWLATAMIVQASELYFARTYIDAESPNFNLYAIELNLICISVLTILSTAALWSWRKRIVNRRDEQKRVEMLGRRQEEQSRRFEAMFESRPTPVAPVKAAPGRVARLIIEPPPL
jgi:hypothetical protein